MTRPCFSPEFQITIERGNHLLRVGSVTAQNKKQISEGLRDLSSASIRNRFLGLKREFTEKELHYLTVLDGHNHYAIGIEETDERNRGVAIVRLVRSSHLETEAEVAVTIIDEYQKKGLGTLLLQLLVLAALERNIDTLSFTFLPQNDGIVKLIHKIGKPRRGEQNRDYEQLFLDLKKLDIEDIEEKIKRSVKAPL